MRDSVTSSLRTCSCRNTGDEAGRVGTVHGGPHRARGAAYLDVVVVQLQEAQQVRHRAAQQRLHVGGHGQRVEQLQRRQMHPHVPGAGDHIQDLRVIILRGWDGGAIREPCTPSHGGGAQGV